MTFLLDYAGFLAKALTVVFAIAALLLIIGSVKNKGPSKKEGTLKVTRLNDVYKKLHSVVENALLNDSERKALKKAQKRAAKQVKAGLATADKKPRVFVLNFEGDVHAKATESLRHEVTALLGHATASDEVVLRLESPGGVVGGYGLAASQLVRIRDAGIPLTVCVDKVAASGGYMMACIGNKIVSAPFAVHGSIGVVAQFPNFFKLLKKNDVDVETITGGEFKRTVTLMGETTEVGRKKFQEEVDSIHEMFKNFVSKYRPSVDTAKVGTGETWFGEGAKDLNLVDEIMTSDEYLANLAKSSDLYLINYQQPKATGLLAKLGKNASVSLESALVGALHRMSIHKGM